MGKRVFITAFVLLVLVAGCKAPAGPGEPTSAPTPAPMPTTVEILPTPTPVPPPPTPVPISEEAEEEMMVAIPAGEFTMGGDFEDERPAHQVFVEAFEIDKLEVTNIDFAEFVEATGYETDAEKVGEDSTWQSYAQGKDNHPVVKVTWNDAVAYCQWCGKRLPTEAEWEKAARGTDGRIYPWGNEYDPNKLNGKDSGIRGTTAVGSFLEGASPYGVMDMAGNVAEWTADWYKAYPGSDFASSYFGEKYRVIRGGGWFSDEELVRTSCRSCSSVDLKNDDVGFRCAQ